jgi:hypothetical protein
MIIQKPDGGLQPRALSFLGESLKLDRPLESAVTRLAMPHQAGGG